MGAAAAWLYSECTPLADLVTGHLIQQTKGSIMVLPWRHPYIRMATASYKGGGNIPVTYRSWLKHILYSEQAARGILMNI